METVTYLVKLGELTLKGGNRKDFEERLVQNARHYLEGRRASVRLVSGRMYVEGPEESVPAIEYALSHLVGIAGWSRAAKVGKTMDEMKAAVIAEAERARDGGKRSFKIEARRADKDFPLTSYEIARDLGEAVYERGILAVDVHSPDAVISVEVRERAFVYGPTVPGHRGLPCGTGGRGLLLLSGGIDSPVAGYRMLKRGMKLDCIYFHSHPYTFRMCMMSAANRLARAIGSKCLITGESLGQVASQTIENMTVTNSMAELPVLRPLVGMDKDEIIATAKSIGTYETSILPYEDCCVLFSPKHPVLKAEVAYTRELYDRAGLEPFVEEAFLARAHSRFGWEE